MTFGTIVFGGMLYCIGLAWLCVELWQLMSKVGRDGKN